MADLAMLESQLRGINQQLDSAKQQYAEAQKAGDAARMAELSNYRAELLSSLTQVKNQIATAEKEQKAAEPPNPATAEYKGVDPVTGQQRYYDSTTGQFFLSDTSPTITQKGTYDNVNSLPPVSSASDVESSGVGATQNPAPAPVVAQNQINQSMDIGPAERSEIITRTGGQAVADDAPGTVKKISQTQSVSPTDGRDTPQASGSVGVGASGDDSGTKQNTLQIIKAAASTKIVPRGNALDQYPNYTYNITWYIMEKDVYKTFFSSTKKSLNGFQILMRSGGAPATTAGSTTTTTGPNSPTNITGTINSIGARNSFFNIDYYIDNLELESLVMGPYNRSPHNVTRLKFTVTEPNGITLVNNIWQAVNQLYQTTKLPYSLAQFCLAVRFYACDSNGNLIPTKDNTNTDANAIIERFYPFTISDIKFRVANKQVEYNIEGLPLTHYMGFGQNLGVIKQQVELSGTSVGQVLGGQGQGSNPVPTSDGRTTVSQIKSGSGVLDAQLSSNTDSTDYTNTRQPNLISGTVTGIPGVNSSF